jgi:hypothetical protein
MFLVIKKSLNNLFIYGVLWRQSFQFNLDFESLHTAAVVARPIELHIIACSVATPDFHSCFLMFTAVAIVHGGFRSKSQTDA